MHQSPKVTVALCLANSIVQTISTSARVIHVITGRPTAVGSSNAQRKKYARSTQVANLPRRYPKTTKPIVFTDAKLLT